MTDVNLDKIIFRVNALLEKADSTEFPEEAQSLRAKAKELIDKYRIDQENLLAVDEKLVSPVLREFPIGRWNSEFKDWFWTLFLRVAEHCEVKVTYEWFNNERDELYFNGKAVGYEIDLRYMELLWSSIRLTFASKIEPEVDRSLSDEENIYRLRSSGIARKDVAQMLWGQWTHANSAKVGKVYKEECRKRGEDPALDGKGIHLKTFKDAYARDFVWRVVERLQHASDGALGQNGAMVFADRKQRVEDAFYRFFPHLKPKPVEPILVHEEPPTEEAVKSRKRLQYWETKAYKKQIERQYSSAAARAGSRAGKSAADEVNLARTADKTGRLEGEQPEPDNNATAIEA